MTRPTVLERFSDDPLLSPGAAEAQQARALANAILRYRDALASGDPFAASDLDEAVQLAEQVLR
jgi:hypothetical protein